MKGSIFQGTEDFGNKNVIYTKKNMGKEVVIIKG